MPPGKRTVPQSPHSKASPNGQVKQEKALLDAIIAAGYSNLSFKVEAKCPEDVVKLEEYVFLLCKEELVCPSKSCEEKGSYGLKGATGNPCVQGVVTRNAHCRRCGAYRKVRRLFADTTEKKFQVIGAALQALLESFPAVNSPREPKEPTTLDEALKLIEKFKKENSLLKSQLEDFEDGLVFFKEVSDAYKKLQGALAFSQNECDKLKEQLAKKEEAVSRVVSANPIAKKKVEPQVSREEPVAKAKPPKKAQGKQSERLVSVPITASYAAKVKAFNAMTELNPQQRRLVFTRPDKYVQSVFTAREDKPPTIFRRLYVQMNLSANDRTDTRKHRFDIVRRFLSLNDLKGHVRDFSMIGKSIVEMYVAEPAFDGLKRKLIELKAPVLVDFEPMSQDVKGRPAMDCRSAIVSRLAALYCRNSLKGMRECILDGYPELIRIEAVKRAEELNEAWKSRYEKLTAQFAAPSSTTGAQRLC